MPRIPNKEEQQRLRDKNLSKNKEVWKIVKKILGEEISRLENVFRALNQTPPKPILQKHLWNIFTNEDLTKPAPIAELPENLRKKAISEIRQLSFVDDTVGTLVTPITQFDLTVRYLVGMKEGTLIAFNENKRKQNDRTLKAALTKKAMRDAKIKHVEDAYIRMENTNRVLLSRLSENQMAKDVKKYVEPLLKRATIRNKPVLKRKVDSQGNISYTGLSLQTIKNILHNSTRISFYPWKKTLSKM